MIGLLLLAVIGFWALYRATEQVSSPDLPHRLSDKIDKLWDIVQESLRDRKYLRAEKALLTGRFLKRKIQEYEALKAEIDALSTDADLIISKLN